MMFTVFLKHGATDYALEGHILRDMCFFNFARTKSCVSLVKNVFLLFLDLSTNQ